tara:strand:+ start:342 stop:671 length:330 start_codon:yes stop_codon:yes gene_type:complete
MIITEEKLGMINAGRAVRGYPPLEKEQAVKLATERRELAVAQSNNSDQSSDFLIRYLIGYPINSAAAPSATHTQQHLHETTGSFANGMKPTSVDVYFSGLDSGKASGGS